MDETRKNLLLVPLAVFVVAILISLLKPARAGASFECIYVTATVTSMVTNTTQGYPIHPCDRQNCSTGIGFDPNHVGGNPVRIDYFVCLNP